MIRNNLCLTLLLAANLVAIAQSESDQQIFVNQMYAAAEKKYGINQELIFGVLFEEQFQDAIGHPYFLGYKPHTGTLIYRDKQYSNLLLQYDIYDQQVLLIHTYDTVEYKIYLKKEFISEFTIENKRFIADKNVDEEGNFYQVIGNSAPCSVQFYWSKGLTELDRKVPNRKRIFSSEERNTFLLINNYKFRFKGNRSFTKLFPAESKAVIKPYLRKNKLNVKYANDHEMELLVEFINTMDINGK